MELKDRLVLARKRAKKTQGEVAAAIGIAQPSYSALESGKAKGSAYTAQIAQFLEVSPVWLATGEGDMVSRQGKASGISDPAPLEDERALGPDATAIIRQVRQLDKAGRLCGALAQAVLAVLKTAPQEGAGAQPAKSAGVLHKHTAEEIFQAQAIQDNKGIIAEQTTGHIRKIRGLKKPPQKQDESGGKAEEK